MAWDLDSYNDVPSRIAEFRTRYPEGTLQAELISPAEHGLAGVVVMRALAYRTPDDPRPGIGWAQEPVPGHTPYTKDSEVQNCETSAWGRAIIAVGAADAKKVASREEVANAQARESAVAAPPGPAAVQGDISSSEGGDIPEPPEAAGKDEGEASNPAAPAERDSNPPGRPGAVGADPRVEHGEREDALTMLTTMVDGNLSRAASYVNKAVRGNYTRRTIGGATLEELDAGIKEAERVMSG